MNFNENTSLTTAPMGKNQWGVKLHRQHIDYWTYLSIDS